MSIRKLARRGQARPACLLVPAFFFLACAGCTTASLSPTAYDISVRLDPATHHLNGQTVLTLRREPATGPAVHHATLDFALNRALKVEQVTVEGATLEGQTVHEPAPDPADETTPVPSPPASATQPVQTAPSKAAESLYLIHSLTLTQVGPAPRVRITYSGQLVQDVQAGEKRGQVHNRLMAAHIGPEGIYLDERGGWYPSWYRPEPTTADLAHYHLTVEPVPGMELVAGAHFDPEASHAASNLVWNSTYPLPDGLALVGGPHRIKLRDANGVNLSLHYSLPADEQSRELIEKNTDLFLAAAIRYLERYQPLIGPFPFRDYAIVENFFSSGFAFPGFTLLNRALFQMGPRALGHGFLDHEMLHCWWGNGVYVDPADGNWCEALTSYAANYYGYVLDGDDQGARNQRRNCCMIFSAVNPEQDKPLGGFERPGGPGREVGYNKGTMVFHMLATRIGQENFWKAMRRLTDEYVGHTASWSTLQNLFEKEGAIKLDRFVQDWVRSPGAPRLELSNAVWLPDESAVEITATQAGTNFELSVPVRLIREDDSTKDELIALNGPTTTAHLESDKPVRTVLLDPDYQILRRLRPEEMVPNVAATRSAHELLVVTPPQPISQFYETAIADCISSGDPAKQVARRTSTEVTAADLAGGSILLVGDAVRAETVQALLARTVCPLKWEATGFRIDDTLYDSPAHAVLCTVHHPDLPGSTITLYYGNSETALGRADLLGYYRDSLVVFETTSRQVDGAAVYQARPIARRDFETVQSVPVSR